MAPPESPRRRGHSREAQTAVEIANTIGDPDERDRLKAEIVRKLLLLEGEGVDD